MASNSSALSLYSPCPPGLATSNSTICDTATCGSIYEQPDLRPKLASGSTQCNSCDPGFTGLNCNVCSSRSSCQARRGSTTTTVSANPLAPTTDSAVVCHNQPDAVRTTHIDCEVVQPTIQAVFPGKLVLVATKVGEPDDFAATGVASWPAQANTTLASVFYEGREQFYCQASSCVYGNQTQSASLGKSQFGTLSTTCDNLRCYCIPGTLFCGGGALDLTPIINGLSGKLGMPCDFIDPKAPEGTTSECAFQGNLLTQLFGDVGLPLKNCRFGSCVTEANLQSYWSTQSDASGGGSDGDKLSGPLIGGLAVLGVVVAALLGILALGFSRRAAARRRPRSPNGPAIGLVWSNIDYSLAKRRRSKTTTDGALAARSVSNEKRPFSPGAEDSHHTALQFDDHAGHDPNLILRSVSGRVEPGQMLAILGPSGAGKSTLIDILAGRNKTGNVSGEIAFLSAGARSNGPTRNIAFVDQDDALPAFSTVREALRMAAELSLPENFHSEVDQVVDDVINLLGLQLVANNRIGDHSHRGVSGGERRRVSIGCALVARPRILVADEPLSGLDAYSASRVISALRNLARGPEPGSTTVIITMHQPSSEIFHSFDSVSLMALGRTLYDGPPSASMAWCEAQGEACPAGHNVADHLLKIAFNPERTSASSQVYRSNSVGKRQASTSWDSQEVGGASSAVPATVTAVGTPVAAGSAWMREAGNVPSTTFMTQLSTLSRRAWLTALRDRAGPLAHILGAICIGLVVGGCFFQVTLTIAGFQNRVGSMYFLYILLCFAALSAATTLSRSRALMVRERSNALYTPLAWLVSFVLFDAVLLRLIPTVLLTTILYWMVGLKRDVGIFFEFLLISFLFHESMALFNMILAAVIEDLSVIVLCAGTSILFNIGYGGFLLNLDQIPGVLRWLQWLSPLKYSLEAVSTHELKGLQLKDQVAGVNISTSVSVFAGNLFGFKDGAFYRDLLVLALGFNVGFFAILCAAVAWRMRERR